MYQFQRFWNAAFQIQRLWNNLTMFCNLLPLLQIPIMASRLFSTTPEKVVEISRAAQFVVRLFSTTPEKVVEISRGSNITVQFIFDPFNNSVITSTFPRLGKLISQIGTCSGLLHLSASGSGTTSGLIGPRTLIRPCNPFLRTAWAHCTLTTWAHRSLNATARDVGSMHP